ncbi:unnamed protein product, partial [Amoebophrya sp. A25]|eukprot:GSA25T00028027001.1
MHRVLASAEIALFDYHTQKLRRILDDAEWERATEAALEEYFAIPVGQRDEAKLERALKLQRGGASNQDRFWRVFGTIATQQKLIPSAEECCKAVLGKNVIEPSTIEPVRAKVPTLSAYVDMRVETYEKMARAMEAGFQLP